MSDELKVTCYNCNREIKSEILELDIGQGDKFYFHKNCLKKWIDKHTKVKESEKSEK